MFRLRQAIPAPVRSFPWRMKWMSETSAYKTAPISSTAKLLRWTALELLNRDADFTTADGVKMRSMTKNFTSLSVFLTGERDHEIQAFIRRRLAPGDTFVDVGANVGVYTTFASGLVGSSGRVLAVEAHPTIYKYLADNIARNELTNVEHINCAAGDKPGQLQIVINARNAGETHIGIADEGGTIVSVERLDDLLPRHDISVVNYLKIDVEGFELPVLKGAAAIISASPTIVIQTELVTAHADRYGYRLSEIVDLLSGLGLKPYKPDANGSVSAMALSDIGKDWDVLWMRD